MEITFPVTYACPRCGVALDAVTDGWRDWVRCPSCGKAGRPPLPRRYGQAPASDVMYIGTFSTGTGNDTPTTNGRSARPYSARGLGRTGYPLPDSTARRAMMGGGFFLSAFLALVSVVQKNPAQAGVFGGVAVVLLFLLARSSARG